MSQLHEQTNKEADSHKQDGLWCIRQVAFIRVMMFKIGFSPFRWPRLPGKIPGKDELPAKMSQLHKQANKQAGRLTQTRWIVVHLTSGTDNSYNALLSGGGGCQARFLVKTSCVPR